MTETIVATGGSAEILAISQLALHRETLLDLTEIEPEGEVERRATRNHCGSTSSGFPTQRCTDTLLCSVY